MKAALLRWAPAVLMTLLLIGAWASVILIALQVSEIVLDTLHQIVELAGMTP